MDVAFYLAPVADDFAHDGAFRKLQLLGDEREILSLIEKQGDAHSFA